MIGDDDLDVFLNINEFGEEITIGSGESETTIKAIFDNAHFFLDDMGQVEVTTQQPMITCKTSDVSGYSQGARVVIRGTQFSVADKRPDGTGFSKIYLYKEL